MNSFAKGRHEIAEVNAIATPADTLWQVVGAFNGLPDFDPTSRWSMLESGGKDRRVGVVGGGEIVERLVHFDEARRTYSYIITELVGLEVPFENYYSTIVVKDDVPGKSSILDWRGWADVRPGRTLDEVENELRGIYQGIARTLRQRFGPLAAS